MQLAACVVGVMHTRCAAAQFETQQLVVAQCRGYREQMVAVDLEGQLVTKDDRTHDGGVERLGAQHVGEAVGDLVEVPAEGARRAAGQCDRTN